jgi:hypothetical protein
VRPKSDDIIQQRAVQTKANNMQTNQDNEIMNYYEVPTHSSSSITSSGHLNLMLFSQVCFKCSADIYKTNTKLQVGDMVSVPCERGYTVGFISREVYGEELVKKLLNASWKPKKIHTHLLDEDNSVKQTLKTKIDTENFALSHCKVLMRGHKSGSLAEVLGTEFQYDNKRLTVFLKKFEDLSVCRLVRKLNEKFRTRISVVEVESYREIQDRALRYLSLSGLDVSYDRLANSHSEKNAQSFLLTKYQQINGTVSASSSVSEGDIAQDYQTYGPYSNKRSRSSTPTLSSRSDDSCCSSISSVTSSPKSSSLPLGVIGQSLSGVPSLLSLSENLEQDLSSFLLDQFDPVNNISTDWLDFDQPALDFKFTNFENHERQFPHFIF